MIRPRYRGNPERTLEIVTHKRGLNSAIRDCFADATHPIAFVCECGAAGCFCVVWLPTSEYDSRREQTGWAALARGHSRVAAEEAA